MHVLSCVNSWIKYSCCLKRLPSRMNKRLWIERFWANLSSVWERCLCLVSKTIRTIFFHLFFKVCVCVYLGELSRRLRQWSFEPSTVAGCVLRRPSGPQRSQVFSSFVDKELLRHLTCTNTSPRAAPTHKHSVPHRRDLSNVAGCRATDTTRFNKRRTRQPP